METRKAAKVLLGAVEAIRSVDPDMSAQSMATFLIIAGSSSAVPMTELLRRTGLSTSAMSRNVALLDKYGSGPGREGLKLVTSYEDPQDRRYKVVELTPRGKTLLGVITNALEKACEGPKGEPK